MKVDWNGFKEKEVHTLFQLSEIIKLVGSADGNKPSGLTQPFIVVPTHIDLRKFGSILQ